METLSNLLFNAAVKKYRFETKIGQLTTEQLFDLPLESRSNDDLNTLAKTINRSIKAFAEEDFVNSARNPAKEDLENKLEIVKAVIEYKQAQNAAKVNAQQIAERKRQLTDLLAQKQTEKLAGLSEKEIAAELKKLG